jgi:hypothetical protein
MRWTVFPERDVEQVGPVDLVSPQQTGLVELGNGFGHPREGLARAREQVAREHVADDQAMSSLPTPLSST